MTKQIKTQKYLVGNDQQSKKGTHGHPPDQQSMNIYGQGQAKGQSRANQACHRPCPDMNDHPRRHIAKIDIPIDLHEIYKSRGFTWSNSGLKLWLRSKH